MEQVNVAIADDNERILDLLEEIINMDKELHVVGKAKNGGKKCVRSSEISSRMSYYWT